MTVRLVCFLFCKSPIARLFKVAAVQIKMKLKQIETGFGDYLRLISDPSDERFVVVVDIKMLWDKIK